MYFYIDENDLEKERAKPGSGRRIMSEEGSKSVCLWNQAMFIISQLLTERLLHINELDPVRRYLPSFNRPRRTGRYSAFQVMVCLYEMYTLSQEADNFVSSGPSVPV